METKIDIRKIVQDEVERAVQGVDELEKKMRGYAFDSLIFRYKMAREKQAQWDAYQYSKQGKIEKAEHQKDLAERDIMRFIQILDDVIGEHD